MFQGWDTYAWMLFNISTLFSCISTEHLTSSFSVTLANKTSLFFLISFTFPPYQAHIRELLCSMPIPSFGMTQFGVNSTDQHCLSALLFSQLICIYLLTIIGCNHYERFEESIIFTRHRIMHLDLLVIITSVIIAITYKCHYLYENGNQEVKQSRK